MKRTSSAVDRYLDLPYHITLVQDGEENGGKWIAAAEELPPAYTRSRFLEINDVARHAKRNVDLCVRRDDRGIRRGLRRTGQLDELRPNRLRRVDTRVGGSISRTADGHRPGKTQRHCCEALIDRHRSLPMALSKSASARRPLPLAWWARPRARQASTLPGSACSASP